MSLKKLWTALRGAANEGMECDVYIPSGQIAPAAEVVRRRHQCG